MGGVCFDNPINDLSSFCNFSNDNEIIFDSVNLPSASPVELFHPSFIEASYVFSELSKWLENFVASPKHIGNNPVAKGSRVPVCPAFFAEKIHLIFDSA